MCLLGYLSKFYWLLAENQKANILHELSYVYVKTHKGIHNVEENERNNNINKKNSYGIQTLNLPV